MLCPSVFVPCRSRAALIFVLFLVKMIAITVNMAAVLIIKAAARELMDDMYAVLVSIG